MAEYITRNNAISAVCFGCNQQFSDKPCEPYECTIRQSIMALPTADVVEVVRCKDCKHLTKEYIGDSLEFICKSAKGMVDPAPDFYCSYGKRKEDDHSRDTATWGKISANAWIGALSGGLTGMRTTLDDNDLKKKYTEEET